MRDTKISKKPTGQLDAPAPGLFRAVLLASNGYLGAKSPFIRSASNEKWPKATNH